MFEFLGTLTARRPWAVCAGRLLAALTLTPPAPAWDRRAQDDDIRFLPADCASVRGYRLLEEAFPQDVFASRVIFAFERPTGEPIGDDDLALVEEVVADLEGLREAEP